MWPTASRLSRCRLPSTENHHQSPWRKLLTMSRQHRSLEQVIKDFWNQVFGKPEQISPPWDEDWKLDEQFFKDLAAWDDQNQESKFLNVVEKIRDATITCKPFMELIPNAPFPARDVVLALSHFLDLGIKVAQAKGEVFKFVDELSGWIVNLEGNFADGRGKFSSRARKNLVHVRNLVNEILKWGWARLHDERWKLIHGMSVVDEIREFNQRLSRARDMFSVLQDVNTAEGIDEILQQIREIKKLRKSQIGEILDHLKRSQLERERQKFLERTLYRCALQDTGYNHQGKTPCDPETRVEILATIKEWMNNLSEGSQNFFWLTGDPGSGKSAITASFARECKDAGVLWAQFFINRNNESTTNPCSYFPTIACQMAEHMADPTLTVVIHEILRKKESLLDELTIEQALELFVKVVQVACDLDRSKPVTIIFDGLDETSRVHLKATATVFSQLFRKLERRNAKVFISSRTDDEITRPFYGSLQTDSKYVKHLHLNTFESRTDVEMYLRRNLEDLVKTWVLEWEQWPGEERFQKLCDQAGGLFIWAVTVVKFFRGQLEKHGRERRNRILNIFNTKGMGDVNNLYGIILKMTIEVDDEDDEWECERFRWIVGFIIGLKEPLTIGDLSGLLDLRETPDSDPVDIIHFVTNLRTVLVAGTKNVGIDTIPRLHKSFVEYVTNHQVDPKCRIDVSVVNGRIASKCLQLVSRLRNGEGGLIPAGSVQYAIRNWTRHLPGEGISESGVGVIGDAEGLEEILSTAAGLKKSFMSASGDYQTHMYDPKVGLPPAVTALVVPRQYHHRSTIQGPNMIRALATSLDGKWIASGDEGGVVQILDSRSHEPIWKADKHDGIVTSICFSPDSRWLVSGSRDSTVRMWDCGTGQAIGSPLLGHNDWVSSVCTDGHRIISGSYDQTVCIWRCDTHQLIGAPINVGKDVHAVALSNDGRVAVGEEQDVCIFDLEARRQIASMIGHTNVVWAVAFSPAGTRVASGSEDKTIRIWDAQTGGQMHRLNGHTACVTSVAFSADGDWIASGSHDWTVLVWNPTTGQLIGDPLKGHTNSVLVVDFSPDNLHLVSGSTDGTIRIWSPRYKWGKASQKITAIHLRPQPATSPNDTISLEGHPSVISSCCSPDGSLYAASTLEGHIGLWNTERALIWQMANVSIHPIHLLRLSETQLVLSAPDGSSLSWNLSNGRPTHDRAITSDPQLTQSDLRQSRSLSDDTVSWFPFNIDTGLWAYVDGDLIRFEGKEGSITLINVPR